MDDTTRSGEMETVVQKLALWADTLRDIYHLLFLVYLSVQAAQCRVVLLSVRCLVFIVVW
ncbi:MAG: hypothetical protein J2P37_17955 [Ktedonobacteraceae bacterium]|nr:hypothetical protein [Ktedonobacteraceae bacterium]